MQSGIAHMFISTEYLDWRSELDHANRAFAATIGGQLYENITREEAKRLRQPTMLSVTRLGEDGAVGGS